MINEIIKYVSLGVGTALLIFLIIIAYKLHVFTRLMDEARDKESDEDDDKKGEDK